MTDEERKQFINEYCRNVGNIKIKCDDCKFVDDCVDYGWKGCRKFTPAPSTPMTTEEWFCQLSTEEKAEVFIEICRDAFRAEEYRRNHWSDLQTIEYWVRWLKQPHTKEKE